MSRPEQSSAAPAWTHLMREVRKGRVDTVVAYKLDRLGRSLPHLAQLVGEMTSHRVALIIPAQGIDTSALKSCQPATDSRLDGRGRVRARDHPRAG